MSPSRPPWLRGDVQPVPVDLGALVGARQLADGTWSRHLDASEAPSPAPSGTRHLEASEAP